MKLSIVIQAGGESRRMGQDKALVPFLGQPLILRVISRIASIADEVLITSNRPNTLAFLEIPTIKDLLPGNGALGGLLTALSVAQHPLVSVIACDMAFVNPRLITAERDILVEQNVDGVVPLTGDGHYEPFHAVYRRAPCLAAVKAALEAGLKRVDCWFSSVRLIPFSPEQTALYDPLGEAFMNINSPEELRHAEAYANSNR